MEQPTKIRLIVQERPARRQRGETAGDFLMRHLALPRKTLQKL